MTSELTSGVYEGWSFSEYAATPAINAGAIHWGMRSMRHLRAYLQGEIENTDSTAKKFGRALHSRIFEPAEYRDRFHVAGQCAGTYGSGSKKGSVCGKPGKFVMDEKWFCGQHKPPGVSPVPSDYVSTDEADRIERIAESLSEHKAAANLLDRQGPSEASVIWRHNELWLKGRIDRCSGRGISTDDSPPEILDLKKCQVGSANHADCEKAIYNYNMHRQAAMYVWGIEAVRGTRPNFTWIFVEDGPPYDVCLVRVDEETLEIGRSEIKHVLRLWTQAVSGGSYPGFSPIVFRGGLPAYARPASSP